MGKGSKAKLSVRPNPPSPPRPDKRQTTDGSCRGRVVSARGRSAGSELPSPGGDLGHRPPKTVNALLEVGGREPREAEPRAAREARALGHVAAGSGHEGHAVLGPGHVQHLLGICAEGHPDEVASARPHQRRQPCSLERGQEAPGATAVLRHQASERGVGGTGAQGVPEHGICGEGRHAAAGHEVPRRCHACNERWCSFDPANAEARSQDLGERAHRNHDGVRRRRPRRRLRASG
mmetsp:Transcript_20794/g.64972  ORF Transcript_20794/g.64972 Transcript_20794/m.64972 type:complete len:235 (+) Transcript_20794:116-820(+)